MTLDVGAWRSRFPALERSLDGRPVAWFDGPGGAQVPRSVVTAIGDVLTRGVSNLGGAYPPSEEAEAIVAGARAAVADLVGAAGPEAIAFGPNMTTLNLALARALSADWGPGDEVVVTRLDHDANISPWLLAARRTGATVRWVDMDPDDGCSLADVEPMLSDRTKVVAVTHASNVVGTIPDVAAVCAAARSVGATSVVDAVHHVPHAPTDMAAIGCDALLCSAYKFHGPHMGVMALAPNRWDLVPERIRPAPDHQPGWWETGTQSFEALAGVTAAIDELVSIGSGPSRRARLVDALGRIHAHTDELTVRFLDGLRDLPSIRLFGIDDDRPRTPTFALEVAGRDPGEVATELGRRGLFVGHGDFYGPEVVRRLDRADRGVVRVGFVSYTDRGEVDRLLEALAGLAPASGTAPAAR